MSFSQHRLGLRMMIAMTFMVTAGMSRFAVAQAVHVEKSELRKQMSQIDEAMKKLKHTIRKAESDKETLELIVKVEQTAIICKQLSPPIPPTIAAPQRDKYVAEYRRQMANFLSDVCQMEAAVLSGDHDRAHQIYTKLKDDEDKGHDQFMPDDVKESTAKEH